MADIIHRIGIKAPEEKVYKGISTLDGLRHWWTENVQGEEQVGGKIEFTFRSKTGELKGQMSMKVEELKAKSIRWKCIEGPEEWIGTEVTFELSQQDDQTIILFGHRKWKKPVEFMSHCSMKWATFLLSLRDYIQTGKGKPSPDDLKIDNWN